MTKSLYDVIIIGTGIAGLAAARHAAQSGLRTATIEALIFGGLIANIGEVDGEISGSGTDLAANLAMEVADLGVENVSQTVTGMARTDDQLSIATDAGMYHARATVVASGARLKRLGIPGEAEFEYKGVSQCADCDGPFYQDQDVIVVGGGDSALQEAMVLARFAKTVHLIHRGEQFRAHRKLIDAVASHNNIVPVWSTIAEEILGGETVTRVRVRNVSTNATSDIACTGFFAYIGLQPACEFVPAEVERDGKGCLVTNAALQTALPGVYAAGAVRAGHGGLLAHAMAEGKAAAEAIGAELRG